MSPPYIFHTTKNTNAAMTYASTDADIGAAASVSL